MVIPVMTSGPVPLLVTVTDCVVVVSTPWLPKFRAKLEKRIPGRSGAAVPVPDRITVWVLPAVPLLLSVIVREPRRLPVAVGEKVTLIVQEPLDATLPAQLSLSPKLALGTMLVTVSALPPVLLRITGCDALVVPICWGPKVRPVVETPATGTVTVPVPDRITVCWLPVMPLLLSVMVKAPIRVPTAVGVNVTLMAHEVPPASAAPQVSVSAKSPLVTMLEIVRGALPTLSSVIATGKVAVPNGCGGKVRLSGITVTHGRYAGLIFATKEF
jgi:hypothetical protein